MHSLRPIAQRTTLLSLADRMGYNIPQQKQAFIDDLKAHCTYSNLKLSFHYFGWLIESSVESGCDDFLDPDAHEKNEEGMKSGIFFGFKSDFRVNELESGFVPKKSPGVFFSDSPSFDEEGNLITFELLQENRSYVTLEVDEFLEEEVEFVISNEEDLETYYLFNDPKNFSVIRIKIPFEEIFIEKNDLIKFEQEHPEIFQYASSGITNEQKNLPRPEWISLNSLIDDWQLIEKAKRRKLKLIDLLDEYQNDLIKCKPHIRGHSGYGFYDGTKPLHEAFKDQKYFTMDDLDSLGFKMFLDTGYQCISSFGIVPEAYELNEQQSAPDLVSDACFYAYTALIKGKKAYILSY